MRPNYLLIFLVAAGTATADYAEPTIDKAKPVNMKTYLTAASAFSSVEYSGVVPFHVTFTDNTDIPKGIKNISYDYGDGLKGDDSVHVYRVPGSYKASMKITDRSGNVFTSQFTIIANADPKECKFSTAQNSPMSYAKHFPIGNGLHLMDLHWDGEYIGRVEDKDAREFRGYVYKSGDLKGTHFSSQNLYEICREPSWRYAD